MPPSSDNFALTDARLPAARSNRPVTLGHRIEFGAVALLVGFFRLIGVDAASFIAGKTLRFVGPLLRSISRRAEENLRAAFPDWSEDKIMATTRDVWENLGRVGGEFAHLDRFTASGENPRVTFEGEEKVLGKIDAQRPAIFVTGHFANWEVGAVAALEAGLKYAIVYRAANNPLVDAFIIKQRARLMTATQIPKGKTSVLMIVKAIKTGASLGLLVDQKLNDGIPAPFFGRDAMTTPAPAWIALRYALPIFPVTVQRRSGAHFTLKVHDPLEFSPTGDNDADVAALTAEINAVIEREIRERPGEWLWLHRRWPKEPQKEQPR